MSERVADLVARLRLAADNAMRARCERQHDDASCLACDMAQDYARSDLNSVATPEAVLALADKLAEADRLLTRAELLAQDGECYAGCNETSPPMMCSRCTLLRDLRAWRGTEGE